MPPQAMVSCAINGLGLALVIPCVQSLVADYHPSESRGKAFGFMFFTASCGASTNAKYALYLVEERSAVLGVMVGASVPISSSGLSGK